MPYFCIVLTIIFAVLYTTYVNQKSDRRWCSVLGTMNTAYREEPPSARDDGSESTNQRLARDIRELNKEIGCNNGAKSK